MENEICTLCKKKKPILQISEGGAVRLCESCCQITYDKELSKFKTGELVRENFKNLSKLLYSVDCLGKDVELIKNETEKRFRSIEGKLNKIISSLDGMKS